MGPLREPRNTDRYKTIVYAAGTSCDYETYFPTRTMLGHSTFLTREPETSTLKKHPNVKKTDLKGTLIDNYTQIPN